MKKTARILCLVLALALCLCFFAGCSKNEKKAETKTDSRTFTVGFDAEFPPYGYLENGEYIGFDLDLAAELCSRLGWTLVKQPIDWDSKDMELDSGSIDCIWNGFTVTGRETEYTWTAPYIDNSQVVIVRKDSGIASLADLAGKDVEVQTDSSALAALTEEEDNDENLALAASFKSLTQVADYNTAFTDLESGLCQAICVDIGVAQYQLQSRGDTFMMLDEILATEQYAVGFKLGNTELCKQVEDVMYEMLKDGVFEKLAEKYGIDPLMICLGK
ncbi:MAG: amino acid ABC transporter substrate-binding protein [Oscillospiraceae bacterium]|nr:amino acid ABC transporter substrate-binding protein [Oscillospiraceae bacterium]